jgi:outer membrane biosynthesis protein TonB
MLTIVLALLLQLPAGAGLIPAKLVKAISPLHPYNAVAGTCVLADVPVDARGRIGEVKIMQGLGPFNDSATRAIKQWQFSPATLNGETKASRVGVLVVFRPPGMGNAGFGGPSLGYKQPTPPKNNHPAMPLAITDPGYPQTATTEGVVILDVPIDKNGNPLTMLTIQDVPQFTDVTRAAVRSWKFMPAMEAGHPVVGMLIVAVSFVRPVVVQQ